ncbi:glycoside hydrolase family protein [Georgenia subflava]|uniref:Uncharacterized protein n=1 Tax=Georgenia subflava TaxID=1622177 RepID=A0A6N7ENB0_9MICO|nr:hypothetical protein [Georgenia subflava]MPV36694.1 hypothetical protein [Georgenia subflava]
MTLTLKQVQRALKRWDPRQDTVLMEPEVTAPNYWVGCASALVEDDRVLITFRRRRPRGGDAERGWQIGVAELGIDLDPASLREIVTVHKDELGTASMERACLVPAQAGGYELYFSYVDPADERWRVDVVQTDDPARLDIRDRRTVFTAASVGAEGVKDPRVVSTSSGDFMILSVARAKVSTGVSKDAHATQDIYNTDHAISLTGLAKRDESGAWQYQGTTLAPPTTGWDSNVTRIGSVLQVAEGMLGFYDGESTWEHNYEELAGLALSADLQQWERLTVDGPYQRSGGATDSLRYIDAVELDGVPHLFYEFTRTDGSHDLRVHRLVV